MSASDAGPLLDAKSVCVSLTIPLSTLKGMARRGDYPELLHVSRGIYRVRRIDHESWMAARWTGAEMAREELAAERIRAELLGRG